MQLKGLFSLLRNANDVYDIDIYRDEIAELIPSVEVMFDFDQKNHAHQYDLWFHCLHTVVNLPANLNDDMVYLAALLHDIGKPYVQCNGKKPDDNNKHYYGHNLKSKEIVIDEVIPNLEFSGNYLSLIDKKLLIYYVEYHDDRVSLKLKHLRRHLHLNNFNSFRNLMQLEVADAKAHIMLPCIENRIEVCGKLAGETGINNYKRILNGE